ncbi:hypothetical protein BSKO_09802 [Bryopsis sp. KO-2023]|nr:hypothetical protein BSKO_09802 [Bryopsis sp. KO-2023]
MRVLPLTLLAAVLLLAGGVSGQKKKSTKKKEPEGFAETIGEGFVRVGGLSTIGDNDGSYQIYFADRNCREFRFSGWNNWEMVEAAYGKASALHPDKRDSVENGRELVHYIFDSAESAGMKVGRFFGHGHGRKKMTLLNGPGDYNEDALQALDWVIAEAGRRGLKLIMTFADNWKDGDSRSHWTVDFFGKEPMDFFTDAKIIDAYKEHITTMVTRTNTVNGIKYKDDPTIFSWNLMNEPRCDCQIQFGGPFCELSCAKLVNDWIAEISTHLKQQDPNHMAVVGEEGFYSLSPWKHWVNPDAFFSGGAPWSQRAGQDFVENHRHKSIDYLSVHTWPDNWGLPEVWFQETWVREHTNDAWWMNKPFVVEEFGKIVVEDDDVDRASIRDPFMRAMYKQFNSIRGGGGPLKGVAFWEFDAANHTKPGVYGIRPTHSTWTDIIRPMSWWVRQEIDRLPVLKNCVPGKERSMDAVFAGGKSYYTTPGVNLLASWEGETIGKALSKKSIKQCVAACEKEASCTMFRYNSGLNKGTCELKAEGGKDFSFSKGGWQTFYKNEAAEECDVEGCALCDAQGICIRCKEKDGKLPAKIWNKKKLVVECA